MDSEVDMLALFENNQADVIDLYRTIKVLGPVEESPNFWSKIANSKRYSKTHRRLCIFILFKRHVRSGQTVGSLAKITMGNSWLKKCAIHIVTTLAGKIPVNFDLSDSVFLFDILPNHMTYKFQVYIKVSGKIPLKDFKKMLMTGKGKREMMERQINEIGFFSNLQKN